MGAMQAAVGLVVTAVGHGPRTNWGLTAFRTRYAQFNIHGRSTRRSTSRPLLRLRHSYGSFATFARPHVSIESTGEVGNHDTYEEDSQLPEEGYVGLFVRMLGMDNPAEEREEAVRALWRHSMGGKDCIDEIIAFPGILALLVSLLPSTRAASSEAAAGLLRNISLSVHHRSLVAKSGALEEIIGILTRRTLSQEVREQAAGCLWILSSEEDIRRKIDIPELLPVLFVMLDSEGIDKEAAAGILANFCLDDGSHDLLVEAGTIRNLVNVLKSGEGSKVVRQEARKALLALAQKGPFKQIIIEEGLIPVPLIGASAYKSFKPLLDVAPSFPEGVNVSPSPPLPSTFGAGNLLVGLNAKSSSLDLDEATQRAIEGRARQHFLGRLGLLEKEANKQETADPSKKETVTLMAWWDGIPRLVLILGLEEASVAALAADTISEIAINEDIREAIQKAGSIPHLVRLLGSGDESATAAAASALERLAISIEVRKSIDAHEAVPALVEVLKAHNAPGFVKEKVVAALDRLSQTGEEVQAMIQSGAFPGLFNITQSGSASAYAKQEAEGILEELSSRKADARDKIVSTGGLPVLVDLLASGVPQLAEKAAHVMENLAVRGEHAEALVGAGIEHSLISVLEMIPEGQADILDAQGIVVLEETWAVVAAATRLLNKLLVVEKVRASMDCGGLALLLARALKVDAPLQAKDWISACLLNLDRLVGITTNVGIPLETEVMVHNKIPRLLDEIGSFDSDLQERAVLELHDLVSRGIEAYVAAIADGGGIFPLVQLLEKGSSKAREAALSVLYNIGSNEENHPALIRAGIVPCLQRIVRSESPKWMLALYLLRTLPT